MPDEQPIETLLDEVEARLNASTQGEWEALGLNVVTGYGWQGIGSCKQHQDLEFIVAAHRDLPRLVRELRQLLQNAEYSKLNYQRVCDENIRLTDEVVALRQRIEREQKQIDVDNLAERITCIFDGATLNVKYDPANKSQVRTHLESLVKRELLKALPTPPQPKETK